MSDSTLADRYSTALFSNDWATLGELRHPDFVARWPQSGEVVRGHDRWVEIARRYPQEGGVVADVHGGKKPKVRPVRTQMPFGPPILSIEGPGDSFTVQGRVRYPDGSVFWVAAVCQIEAGKVISETAYFAEPFDPPAWRADLVELEDG